MQHTEEENHVFVCSLEKAYVRLVQQFKTIFIATNWDTL